MSLHSGIDTVGIISVGTFSQTYGAGEVGNIANLKASLGYIEDATDAAAAAILLKIIGSSFKKLID